MAREVSNERSALGAHWIRGPWNACNEAPVRRMAEHQWSGSGRRRVLEQRKLEMGGDQEKRARRMSKRGRPRRRSERDRGSDGVLIVPRGQQGDGAFVVGRGGPAVDPFMQLRNRRQNEGEEDSGEATGCDEYRPGEFLPVAEPRLHSGPSFYFQRQGGKHDLRHTSRQRPRRGLPIQT